MPQNFVFLIKYSVQCLNMSNFWLSFSDLHSLSCNITLIQFLIQNQCWIFIKVKFL